jgi:hypothetical protein
MTAGELHTLPVIPAKAGIQDRLPECRPLDPRLRGDDEKMIK